MPARARRSSCFEVDGYMYSIPGRSAAAVPLRIPRHLAQLCPGTVASSGCVLSCCVGIASYLFLACPSFVSVEYNIVEPEPGIAQRASRISHQTVGRSSAFICVPPLRSQRKSGRSAAGLFDPSVVGHTSKRGIFAFIHFGPEHNEERRQEEEAFPVSFSWLARLVFHGPSDPTTIRPYPSLPFHA